MTYRKLGGCEHNFKSCSRDEGGRVSEGEVACVCVLYGLILFTLQHYLPGLTSMKSKKIRRSLSLHSSETILSRVLQRNLA